MRVRYYGHVGERTGYGRAAEATCNALLDVGVDLDVRPLKVDERIDLTRDLPLANCVRRYTRPDSGLPDIIVVHTLPLDTPRVLAIERIPKGQGPKLVAYTTWEGASPMPDSFRRAFEAFDAVCFPSSHNLDRLPVDPFAERNYSHEFAAFVVPHALERTWAPTASEARGMRAYYYVGAWSGRKNPTGLIRAFVSEFDRSEGVSLTLYCAGASRADVACAMAATGIPQSAHPRVEIVTEFVPDAVIARCHSTHGCFVSATRGEAWNYPAFDAMMAGRAIIVPELMGHDDFLNETTARRYRSYIQPAESDVVVGSPVPGQSERELNLRVVGAHGLDCRSSWLDPDLRSLSAQMRRCRQRDEHALGLEYDPAERYNSKTVGANFLKNLESL